MSFDICSSLFTTNLTAAERCRRQAGSGEGYMRRQTCTINYGQDPPLA